MKQTRKSTSETTTKVDRKMTMVEINPEFKNANGRITIESDRLAPNSVNSIMQYGINHLFGNVQQAKVTARVRQMLAEQRNVKATSIDMSEVKAYRKSHPDWEAETLAAFERDALQDCYLGNLGVRETTVVRDPVEQRTKQLVLAKVRGIIESKGKKLPKDDTVRIEWGVDRATGEKIFRTRSEFLTNGWNSFANELREVAREQLRREAEEHAKQMANVPEAAEEFESLGV